MKALESNIWKLQLVLFLRNFLVIMPIIVLFLQENGLSMTQVLILQSIFAIGIVVLEVPSGYLADMIGRKKTIVMGVILASIGHMIFSISHSFLGFLTAELFFSVSVSFISGADSALLYDTLLELKKERKYHYFESSILRVKALAETTSALLGGLLAMISLRTTAYATAIIMTAAIPIALSLVEPKVKKAEIIEEDLNSITKALKYAFLKNKKLGLILLYSGIMSSATITGVWFVQPYLKNLGLKIGYFGLVWALFNMTLIILLMYTPRIEVKLGEKRMLSLILITLFTAYLLLSLNKTLTLGLLFIMLLQLPRALGEPTYKYYINKLTPSRIRATTLSIKNLFMRLFFSMISPLIGRISDSYTINTALLTAGITFTLIGGVVLGMLIRGFSRGDY